MLIKLIIAQRKCAYPGEFAPESMESISEFGHDENPDYLNDLVIKYRETGEFEAVTIVTLDVPNDAIQNVLNPKSITISAVVTEQ